MLQPFEKFNIEIIVRLKKLGRIYIVTQSYTRAPQTEHRPGRVNLLVTDYSEPGQAKLHLNAVKTDRWAAIIDLSNEYHEKKLRQMLSSNSVYNLYFAVVKSYMSLENQINVLYRYHMKRYIDNNTSWRLNRSIVLRPSVELTFGELFVTLEYAAQSLQIRLSEVENLA